MTAPVDTIRNNSSAKAFGGVLAIVAIIAGLYAMVEPMGQRIDFQTEHLHTMQRNLETHAAENNHPWGVVAEIAKVQEKFVEVETQFRGMRDLGLLSDEQTKARLGRIEAQMLALEAALSERRSVDAAVWERVKLLERQVYGRSREVSVGEALGASGPED